MRKSYLKAIAAFLVAVLSAYLGYPMAKAMVDSEDAVRAPLAN